jgi:hypothetical protein
VQHRKLSRSEAVEQYLISLLKLDELLQLNLLWTVIKEHQHQRSATDADVRLVRAGPAVVVAMFAWFDSLVDRTAKALNMFDVWASLFPEQIERIRDLQNRFQTELALIRRFRTITGSHAHNRLREHIAVRKELNAKIVEVGQAIASVMQLGIELSEGITDELAEEIATKEMYFGVRLQVRRW